MTRNQQQNLPCARCGHNPKEPVVVQYSDTARHFLRTDDSEEPIRSVDDESDEAAFLREELKRGRDMLTSVNKDIATLQAMLGDLQAKRNSLQKFVDDHAAILSRVCLPPELLAKIFHLVHPVIDTNVKKGIWQLGRVCSYWRSVLLSSPSLWSTVSLYWQSVVPITEEILSLSGNSPLRITLSASFDDKSTDEEKSVLFGTILATSHRWYAITFDISHSQHPPLNQLKGRIPMLTEVICSDGTSLDWLEGAPSLQKLEMGFAFVPSSIPALPWSQLRIYMGNMPLDWEYQILHQCVNLERYTLRSREPTGPVPFDLLCMSKLRTLMVPESACNSTTFMDILTVPSLDEVRIKSSRSLTEQFLLSFSNLLSRSHCFPTKLEIGILPMDSLVSPLFSLVSLQNLTTLHVSYYMHDLQLVSALTLQPETERSAILLPRLEKLYFHPVLVQLDDITPVIDMVRSRWHLHERVGVVSRLAFFAFIPRTRICDRPLQLRGTLIPLFAFRDEGLEMDIDRFYLERAE